MQQILARFRSAWDNARTSLWFAPSILVTAAIILSFVFLQIDRTYAEFINTHLTWLFSGTPSSAQQILTSIAGAVITVVSIAFSLTIIAMQQASVQYSPRVLRNFTSDKGNQLVLGFYIATFTYALLVLRAVRTTEFDGGGFVPSISLSFAVLFAVTCMALLVYFINHIATSLQAGTITAHIHRELLKQIEVLYPEQIGKAPPSSNNQTVDAPNGTVHDITSTKGGYVTRVDEESLDTIDFYDAAKVHICHKVGDFISHGEVIVRVTMPGKPSKVLADDLRKVITITNRRSIEQDPLYAIRQLVDTALKGLSPGINDTTTSNYCIRYLGDALGILAKRNFPSEHRVLSGNNMPVQVERPEWDDFVRSSFNEILHNIRDNSPIYEELLAALQHIASMLPHSDLLPPILALLVDIESMCKEHLILASDKERIAGTIQHIRLTLAKVPTA